MKFTCLLKHQVSDLPPAAGVYVFVGLKNEMLYIGKAVNIKERVKNHFSQPGFKDNIFLPETVKIGYIATSSEIEALILEAELIKKYQPRYNTMWKDSKNYFYVAITKEKFPRVFITHQTSLIASDSKKQPADFLGPFVDGQSLKLTLQLLRKIFPYRSCNKMPKKPCLWFGLKRCSAPCLIGSSLLAQQSSEQTRIYRQNIRGLVKILQGRKARVMDQFKQEMEKLSREQQYETAAQVRNKLLAFESILNNAHILKPPKTPLDWQVVEPLLQQLVGLSAPISRLEGYDISNIQGQQATGSMIVFANGQPSKKNYRKFKIKMAAKPNDTAMIKEVIRRRLRHPEWPLPQVMLIDGGKGQLEAAIFARRGKKKTMPLLPKIMSLAKRNNELYLEGQTKPLLLKSLPSALANLILQMRDEAHRFAVSYHHKLRSNKMLKSV